MNTRDYKKLEQDVLGFLELESGPMREVEEDFLSLFKQYTWSDFRGAFLHLKEQGKVTMTLDGHIRLGS